MSVGPRLRVRLRLFAAAAVVAAADLVVTLAGQSAAYWSGDYAAVRERAPHARWLLRQHPAAFAGGFALYLLAAAGAVAALPRPWARVAAMALVIGHAWGTGTWLVRLGGYWHALAFFALVAWLTVQAFDAEAAGVPTDTVPSNCGRVIGQNR